MTSFSGGKFDLKVPRCLRNQPIGGMSEVYQMCDTHDCCKNSTRTKIQTFKVICTTFAELRDKKCPELAKNVCLF